MNRFLGESIKKTMIISLTAVTALSASEIDGAFAVGKATGHIRAAHVGNDYDAGGNNYTTAIGGELKYETAAWNDLRLGVAVYISQKAGFATGDDAKINGDFLDENKNSYAYIGEGYIDYSRDDFTLHVGRQLLDTPLADTDDIRMNPNTFEAAIATYNGIEGTTLVGGYVTRWAGYDSGDDKSTFKKLGGAESNGVVVVGALNKSVENFTLQGWYYGIDRVANAFYADTTYVVALNDMAEAELSAQYVSFSEDKASGVDGNAYGLGINVNVGMLTVGASYNSVSNDDGKIIVNGYGGGPYLTSMEEWTIDGMEDAKAYQLSGEFDFGSLGINNMTLTALYGVFKSVPLETKVREWDIIAVYAISEAVTMDASYAKINDCYDNADNGADAGYSRFLARINYNF